MLHSRAPAPAADTSYSSSPRRRRCLLLTSLPLSLSLKKTHTTPIPFSIVPSQSQAPDRERFERFVDSRRRAAGLPPRPPRALRASDRLFENHGAWLQELLLTVQELGAQLDDGVGGSADPASTFPKAEVLEELEAIVARVRDASQESFSSLRGRVVQCMLGCRVPYLTLLTSYACLLQNDAAAGREDAELEHMQLLDSALFCARQWLEVALVYSPAHEKDARNLAPLIRVGASGRSTMTDWIAAFRNKRERLRRQADGAGARRGAWLQVAERELEELSLLVARFSVSL